MVTGLYCLGQGHQTPQNFLINKVMLLQGQQSKSRAGQHCNDILSHLEPPNAALALPFRKKGKGRGWGGGGGGGGVVKN